MCECVGVFNTANRACVLAFDACGFVANVLATGVYFGPEALYDVGVLVVDVVGFTDVVFEVVEFVDFLIVFANVEFPWTTAYGFDGVAFVIKEGVVL